MASRPRRGADKEDYDIADQLKKLTDKVDVVSKQQQEIAYLVNEIKLLREINQEQAVKIASLETRVDELEQYTRKENVIISGLDVRHKSYSRVVANDDQQDDLAPDEEQRELEDKVIQFLETKNIKIKKSHISACHTLRSRGKDQPPPIIIRFTNRKDKVNLLKQGKNLQGTNVFVNEHLTSRNARMAKHARDLRKRQKLKDTWIRSGTVFIRMKDEDGGKVSKVKSPEDFVRLGLEAMASN